MDYIVFVIYTTFVTLAESISNRDSLVEKVYERLGYQILRHIWRDYKVYHLLRTLLSSFDAIVGFLFFSYDALFVITERVVLL